VVLAIEDLVTIISTPYLNCTLACLFGVYVLRTLVVEHAGHCRLVLSVWRQIWGQGIIILIVSSVTLTMVVFRGKQTHDI
jgi:hypothetical protein